MKKHKTKIPIIIPNQEFYTNEGFFSSGNTKRVYEVKKNRHNQKLLSQKINNKKGK